MKVIDLYNKIANGEEVPKKIKVYNDIYEYESFNKIYWNSNNKPLLAVYNGRILNYEVEILEEEKEIPERLGECAYVEGEIVYSWSKNEIILKDKINEIMDYLDYLKSKGDE